MKIIIITILLILVCMHSSSIADTNPIDTTLIKNAINTQEDAVETALKIAGLGANQRLDSKGNYKYNASIKKVSNDVSEFTREVFCGKSAWQVTFDSVRFNAGSAIPSGDLKSYKYMNIAVLLDSISGNLLEVNAINVDNKEYDKKDYSYKWPYQLGGSGKYISTPQLYPNLSFIEVIKKYESAAMVAKEIIGINVLISYMNKDVEPVWVITMMGRPTWKSASGNIYRDSKYIINSYNGDVFPVESRGF
ncbi:MAG: hypothetical protein GY865_02420 [candidate division Zixibacteria bacterium]|nr:hypothetical protein [candidate division Zixibacteria bacterium]